MEVNIESNNTKPHELTVNTSTKCKSTYLRDFLGIENSSVLSKIYKNVGIDTKNTTRGRSKELDWSDCRKILSHRGYNLEKEAVVLSYFVNKGGVGKSTLAYLTSLSLSMVGLRVLCIDTDSQGNTTETYPLTDQGYTINEMTPVLLDVIESKTRREEAKVKDIRDCIIEYSESLHIMPSTIMNQNISDDLLKQFNKNTSSIFKTIIDPIKKDYDVIIVDCAPNLLTLNASISCASDLVIMPSIPHPFSKAGLEQTDELLNEVAEDFKLNRIARKVLFNKHHSGKSLTHKYLGEIAATYTDELLSTVLKENAEYARVVDEHANPFSEKGYKYIGKEILSLAKEIIELPELQFKTVEKSTLH